MAKKAEEIGQGHNFIIFSQATGETWYHTRLKQEMRTFLSIARSQESGSPAMNYPRAPSHIKTSVCSISFAGNATTSEKLLKILKL